MNGAASRILVATIAWLAPTGCMALEAAQERPPRDVVKNALENAAGGGDDAVVQARLALRLIEDFVAGHAQGIDLADAVGIDAQIALLLSDPLFADRVLELLEQYAAGKVTVEIFDGYETDRYPECVAVGCDEHWHCSGVLFAANAVLTAAHCFCPDDPCRPTRVAFGRSVDVPELVVAVLEPKPRRTCPGFFEKKDDLCVLVLDRAVVEYEPIMLATTDQIDGAKQLRIIGFGLDERARSGVKRTTLVTVRSADCTALEDPEDFDCITEFEMVAGGPLLGDTCKGDSGGPALVGEGTAGALAAITSRPILGIDQCGDGGIYVRVDRYEDWLRGIPEIEWP